MRYLLSVIICVIASLQMSAQIDTDSLKRSLIARADTAEAAEVFRLSQVFDRGVPGVERDSVLALNLLRRAADMKYPGALNMLGFRYYNGEGVERDAQRALDLIEEAASLGDPRSYNNLGWLLTQGEEVERDYDKAAYWLKRASDAGVGTAAAMLGDLYSGGLGVARDTLAADSLYSLAIERGVADAQWKLLEMRRDDYRALPADSLVNTGLRYYLRGGPGLGVALFEMASQKGSPHADALLADAATRAVGVPYDYNRSLAQFYKAAEGGYAPAQFIIAELLDVFPDALKEVPPELLPAGKSLNTSPTYWYEQAALKGITDADTANRVLLSPDTP